MADWQDRVIKEHAELVIKANTLASHMNTAAFSTLEPDIQDLMAEQYRHMTAYISVLKLRIARFE